jgi:hypothetical protein
MARHHEDEPSFGRTALTAAGIAAGVLAAVIVAVLIVGSSSSAPATNPAPLGLDATVAAKSSAAASSSATSARASSSARPSTSASRQPTGSRTSSSQAPRPPRTSSAAPAPSTHTRTSSASRSPTPTPTPTSHLTFTIPGHPITGTITIRMPADWAITGSSGGQRSGNSWTVVFGQVTVSVAGPRGSHETMTATINPALGNTTVQSYSLS